MQEWTFALLLMFGGVVAMLLIGLPIVFAFLVVNIVGAIIFLGGEIGLTQMVRNMGPAVANYSLAPVPLFVLMGEIMLQTGMASRSIDAIDRLISRVPGRLSIVAVLSGTVFSSLSGSTIANVAVVGRTLYPQMHDRGYHPVMAVGPVLAVGGIAMLIPPSSLGVLLGSLAQISINDLLLTAIVPGVLMALLFLGFIIVSCVIRPDIAPVFDVKELTWKQRLMPVVTHVLPLMLIFVAVVGSMFTGVATPTEASAIGVLATIVAAAGYRALSIESLRKSLVETTKFSGMLLIIICTSGTFSQILAFSGATQSLAEMVTSSGLTPLLLVLGMLAVLVFLGCFMDQLSMMMLTLPIFMPIVAGLGIDQLWFGVLVLIVLEISLITPPFGLLLFVMQGVVGKQLKVTTIYAAVAPFILLEFIILALMIVFPQLTSWLPGLLR
ncbi:TRAP transporter large permease [Martelella mediterranea]|uniref:TRAP transporter large permease n=1 Tax=Martelella mediterranea TaxID=293089 RepID=UPI001E45E783|nr:TRAP transporter large permease [Martelella mediterranea]MCD1634369.1 TRAP transporter large permease [Martelella mediterranea]